ncbi:DoxX family protein [Euzebyella saccharophila]|uniref:DoxX family protein n=1 Tax=Euzebyella saccharophila TaxID=679664 RepID=A0ABV8JXQ4_9FLAO|nr:DoxX family protein [Euzebyella saccharophila]
MKKTTLFYLLRLPLAVSMFGHGTVRLTKLDGFRTWMVETTTESAIPTFLIIPFSYALPIVEFGIGLLMLLSIQVKYALVAGLVVMSLLILGSCSIENWGAVGVQLVHAVYFGLLLFAQDYSNIPKK